MGPNTRRTARRPWRAANTNLQCDTQLRAPLGSPPPGHHPYLVQRDATPKVGASAVSWRIAVGKAGRGSPLTRSGDARTTAPRVLRRHPVPIRLRLSPPRRSPTARVGRESNRGQVSLPPVVPSGRLPKVVLDARRFRVGRIRAVGLTPSTRARFRLRRRHHAPACRSTQRSSAAAGVLAATQSALPAIRATTHVEGKAIRSSRCGPGGAPAAG